MTRARLLYTGLPETLRGARAMAMAGVLGLALTGCAALEPDPSVPDVAAEDPVERVPEPEARRYPWCDADPLPAVDDEYRQAMHAIADYYDLPLHVLERTGLRLQPDAEALQPISVDANRGMLAMSPDAAWAWILMQSAAQADGVNLIPLSAYRSPTHQRWIIHHRLARGDSVADVLRTSMPPGFSEHHTGDAIDLATPAVPNLVEAFADTDAYAWLQENAARHCFELSYPENNPYGIDFEPWHWRFVRRAAE